MNEFLIDAHSLLGAIVWNLEKGLSPYRTFPTDAEDRAIRGIYQHFDERFDNRPDYKLWRTGLLPHFSASKPWLYKPETPFLRADQHSVAKFGVLCAESDDRTVLWSAIGLAASIIRDHQKRGIVFNHSGPLWTFVDRLYGRLRYELDPLLNCPASCGLAAAFFMLAYQNLYHNSGRSLRQSELDDFFNLLEHWFNVTDPEWQPGRKLSLARVENEKIKSDIDFAPVTTPMSLPSLLTHSRF